MQLKPDALAAHLSKAAPDRLARVYTVSGDEPLQALEAQDAVRAAARGAGFAERHVLHVDARADWSQLTAASQSLSLFAQRQLIEIRLPSGKPGRDGAAALQAYATHTAADGGGDTLTIVALPKLERATRESAWATALERAGVWIEIPPLEREALPRWIAGRLARQGQSADPAALELLADLVEGNLLAAHQEILKLGLLHPAGSIDLEALADNVQDVARFDVFGLPQAMLGGDAARCLRSIDGLQAEGEALPLVLWAVAEEIRALLIFKSLVDGGRPEQVAGRDARLWGPRLALAERALPRLSARRLAAALAGCARVDRVAKGLRSRAADSDPWIELADIVVGIAADIGRQAASVHAAVARPT